MTIVNLVAEHRLLRAMGRFALRLVCVFSPALTGQETHDADGSYDLAVD